jgi:ATP-binding cassette subfamily B protein
MKYFSPHDHVDCGPTCLRMIANYYGRNYNSRFLQKISFITRNGVSLSSLALAGEQIGFKPLTGQLSLSYLINKAYLPCILYWDKGHFVVLYKIKKIRNIFSNTSENFYYIADPGKGKVRLNEKNFKLFWLNGQNKGFALFLEPTPDFYNYSSNDEMAKELKGKKIYNFLFSYFNIYKKNYFQVVIAILIAGFISLLFPFLTQSIIDYGIQDKDLNFIILILLAQISLFTAGVITEIVRSHLLLHIGARVNISILSDFLLKLMKLPISFFDSKMAGDLMERVSDNKRIEDFVTTTLLTSLFSIVNLGIYSFVLGNYSINILSVFMLGSSLSILWTFSFMKWRRSIDYIRFRDYASSHDKLYEMVNGMPEIKLNGFEEYTRWQLEQIKIKLFKTDISNLKLEQYQQIGSDFFNQLKNILIVFLAAYDVIQNNITLGMMLAISYIMGQLNVPINQFVNLINSIQSTKIAIERMNEVYIEVDEEDNSKIIPQTQLALENSNQGLVFKNVSFRYGGKENDFVLKEINFIIPKGKITAIVGSSGSGKTTLLKLLLKFYPPTSGDIYLDGYNLEKISPKWWRERCGTVMQEGFIFSETIKNNIIMGDNSPDPDQIVRAVETANIEDFILETPMNFETKIGASGIGISTGQKQRILIARAIYKDPEYLFFDEATSSLDAKNEREIMENLNQFFHNKTVVVVAHRLSTVKNAHQIVVLEHGEVVEVGTHHDLVKKEGQYFNLIKNQLELGV